MTIQMNETEILLKQTNSSKSKDETILQYQ